MHITPGYYWLMTSWLVAGLLVSGDCIMVLRDAMVVVAAEEADNTWLMLPL